MINFIVNNIVNELEELDFYDKLTGIVKTAIVSKSNRDSNGSIENRFPVSYNTTTDQINKGDYIDFTPNDKYRGLCYWEDKGTTALNTDRLFVYFQSNIRLISWFNLNKINENGTIANINTLQTILVAKTIAKIPNTLANLSYINRISIELVGQTDNNANIFSNYTYSESKSQYMIYPFYYFGLDYKIKYSMSINCIDNLLINEACC